MYINKEDTAKILQQSENKLLEVIGEFGQLRKSGASYVTKCPRCGSEKGLEINTSKKVFKCFKCGEVKGKKPIDYLMTGQNMNYPDALAWLAQFLGIILTEQAPKKTAVKQDNAKDNKKKEKGKNTGDTFCDQMLASSGLEYKDILANVLDDEDGKALVTRKVFKAGTIDKFGKIVNGDDMVIEYYDLAGKPVKYTNEYLEKHSTEHERNFYRIRWHYPDEHKDKNGRAAKYHTPVGASTPLYIPEKVRDAYRHGREIKRLFIQEGEKKAEKASKHGLMSLGISGIQNLGYKGELPEDIARIVETCNVREIIFLLDSDCFDITDHVTCNDPIERRPLNFFYAVKNYREYLNTLKNRGFYIEVYFGHVLKNKLGDKGVDDLLANTLKGSEDKLAKDIETTINLAKDKVGQYVHLYKITTVPDSKIKEVWDLNNPEKFCARYQDVLKNLPEFTFNHNKWRYNEDGELESAQPVQNDEQFWMVGNQRAVDAGKASPQLEFRYERCMNFLHNRGFGKYIRDSLRTFVRVENKIVNTVSVDDIRDFLMQFTRAFLKEDILEMLHRGGAQYVGDFHLQQMKYAEVKFKERERDCEYLYWKDKFWKITASEIKEMDYSQLHHFIWGNQKKEYNPPIMPDLWKVQQIVDNDEFKTVHYTISLTDEGKKCDFLRFLVNASNFTWRREKKIAEGKQENGQPVKIEPEEFLDNQHHLVAKLCAIGYMLSEYKDPSVTKAVVGVDGKQSEIGESNGRSGKSLLGELFNIATPTNYIDGKIADVERDTFIWTEITENTRIVFIDDVKRSFDFEMMLPKLTGPWAINYKGGGRVTLPFNISPKLYITTNHVINGDSDSFLDRQWSIAFSDFYNARHKPTDDFGQMFFSEWNQEQWNLFWNMIAQCIKLYHIYGYVESPGERIQQRRLRQSMGEEFIAWADEYFSNPDKINTEILRKNLFEDLLKEVGVARSKFYTASVFKNKLKSYCKWKGYRFNPQKYNKYGEPLNFDKDGKAILDDKRNGVEYFIIGDSNYKGGQAELDLADKMKDVPDSPEF